MTAKDRRELRGQEIRCLNKGAAAHFAGDTDTYERCLNQANEIRARLDAERSN